MRATLAKKKQNSREMTLTQKEKLLFRTTLVEGVILVLLCLYLCLSYSCYANLHPRNTFNENFSGTMDAIMENYFYFLPINYDISDSLLVCFIVAMLIFVQYTYAKIRLHHNVNTLKGKTSWAEFSDILDRYADYEETKGFFARLFKK